MTQFLRDLIASIDGAPGYRVTTDGRILSQRANPAAGKWAVLKPSSDSRGYQRVQLRLGGGQPSRQMLVHRIVAMAFLPNPDGLPCVRHLDGNPANNVVDNLAWGTYSDNEQDKKRHGTFHFDRQIIRGDALEFARQLRASGATFQAIALQLGVNRRTVSRTLAVTK